VGKFLDFKHSICKQQDQERMDRLKLAVSPLIPAYTVGYKTAPMFA